MGNINVGNLFLIKTCYNYILMNNNLALQLFNKLTSYIHNNTTWEFKIIDSHICVRNKQLRDLKEFRRYYTYSSIEISNNVNLEDELNYFLIGGILCKIKNNEIRQQHVNSLIETLHNYNNIHLDLPGKDLIDLLKPIVNNYNKNNSTLEELAIHLDLMGI